jgi:hypothetical protein
MQKELPLKVETSLRQFSLIAIFLSIAAFVGVILLVMLLREKREASFPLGPFVNLEEALKEFESDGWTMLIPPEKRGPYRTDPSLSRFTASRKSSHMPGPVTYKLKIGPSYELVQVPSSPNYEQMGVALETEEGNFTWVILKRE